MGEKEWVALSFILFLGLLAYLKVPGMVARALDKRADDIKNELEEARRLKEEAQAILSDYQRKRKEAEQEAENIIAQAKVDAENLADETRRSLQEMLERRTRMAEEKIARAEEQATTEVRSAAANLAITAARDVIGQKLSAGDGDPLIDKSIASLGGKLN